MEKKITGWATRDENGILFIYTAKPVKDKSLGVWYNLETNGIKMDADKFTQVKWEDEEPTKVELTIKICE